MFSQSKTGKVVKHDVLYYQRSMVHIIAATVNFQSKTILCGHFYINNCSTKEVVVESGTGVSYLIEIPDEYLDIENSSQFNVTLFLIKEILKENSIKDWNTIATIATIPECRY